MTIDAYRVTRRIRLLCRVLASLTLVLVGLGSYVRGTGAGLACPDWPLCFDRAFPELVDGVRQEVLHRYLAGVVGVLTLILVAISFRDRVPAELSRPVKRFAVGAFILVIVQAVFGGLTVLMLLNPFVVTTHLALGTLFFQAVGLVALERLERRESIEAAPLLSSPTSSLRAKRSNLSFLQRLLRLPRFARDPRNDMKSGARALVLFGVIATFFQIVLGGFIGASGASLVCPGFPLCDGHLFGESAPQMVHMLHRITAFLLLGVACGLVVHARRPGGALRTKKGHIMGIAFLMFLQLVIGVGNLHMKISTGMTVVHLVIAELILLALLTLYRDVSRSFSVVAAPAPSASDPVMEAVNA